MASSPRDLGTTLDIDAVRARADAVLGDALYWFPVRHHSPAVAFHLRSAMRARRPKLILMEGPAQASEMVRHVVHAKTKPPVAIYCSYRDDDNVLGLAGIESPAADIPPRFATWYPLLPYSPEFIAMREAKAIGAEVVFIDLPHHGLIRSAAARGAGPAGAEAEAAGKEGPAPEPQASPEAAAAAETREESAAPQHDWEHLLLESSFYQTLAKVAGYRSFNECWDSLFEMSSRHPDHEEFRRDLAYFCASVRATTPADRIAGDGTLERERHMWQSIRRELQERKLDASEAMVVCGGFHLFLDREDAAPPPELPKGTVYTTVAPFSYFRTSELAGYGAGNRAPRYYQLLWENLERGAGLESGVEAMVEHVVAVLSRGRKEGEGGLSSADAISVTQHARMLASLRNRPAPVLDDIRDALISCCCKGRPEDEGAHLLRAMEAVEVGSAVGRVTPELGRLPLVHDFYAQLDDLELGEVMGKEKRLKVVLDLRDPLGMRRSVFMHRLTELDIPLGKLTDSGAEGATLFKEIWSLAWSPRIESELIEKNLYGDSIEAAATAMLDEELAKDELSAARTCHRLVRSANMDLPGMVMRMQASCGAAIDADKRFGSLSEALTHLVVLDRLAAHKRVRRDVISELITRCYGRACFAIPDVASVPVEQQAEVIRGLQSIAETLLGDAGAGLDRALFSENVRAAAGASPAPFLRGAFCGILTEIREQSAEDLAREVAAFARERPEVMIHAGEFLDGVMAVSRTSILLGADALIGAIDDLVRAADWQCFVTMLPRVRGAFERLHERHRRALCDRVAQRYGLADGDTVATITTSHEAALQMAAIDARVAEIMKEWS